MSIEITGNAWHGQTESERGHAADEIVGATWKPSEESHAQHLSVGECISAGWAAFRAHSGPCVATTLLFIVLNLIGQIPVLGFLFALLVGPALGGGWATFGLNLSRDSSPAVSNLWSGFRRFGSFLGAGILLVLVELACLAPCIVVALSLSSEIDSGSGAAVAMIVLLALIGAGVFAYLMLKWCFVSFLLADDDSIGVIDAFHESSRLTEGHRWKLLGLCCTAFALILAGLLCFGIGLLVAAPVVIAAVATAYVRLRDVTAASRDDDAESWASDAQTDSHGGWS